MFWGPRNETKLPGRKEKPVRTMEIMECIPKDLIYKQTEILPMSLWLGIFTRRWPLFSEFVNLLRSLGIDYQPGGPAPPG